MEFLFNLLAVIIVVAIVGGVAIVGFGVFGITRIVKIIADRLPGGHKQPKRMQGTVAPTAAQPAAQPQPKPRAVPRAQPRARSYEYFDVDAGATANSISAAMNDYVGTPVTGFYAREVVETLKMAELRKKALFSEIDAKFSPKSISWDHFASTTQEALDAILRNCALLANRVQAFDVDDYAHMEQFYRTGGAMRNGEQDPARIKRWELLRSTKDEMDDIRSANEALLLELNKLGAALSKISSAETTGESARIAQEVSRLADETKYYR